jgi:hypothetical protein
METILAALHLTVDFIGLADLELESTTLPILAEALYGRDGRG